MNRPLRLLLIEDNPGDALLIREALSGANGPFELETVDRLAAGLGRLRTDSIDVLLLDLGLPDSQGMASFAAVREAAPALPIIVLTGLGDDALALIIVQAGAQDYLVKGQTDGQLLWRAIRYALERQRAQDRIQWLTKAVEQSPASVLITDTRGTIQYVNARFTEITGYTSEEAIGRTPGMLKSGSTSDETYRDLWATISDGREWRGELQNRRKNGEPYWDDALISPIRNPAGVITHYLAVQRDVTERKRTEAEIRSLTEDLERRVRERTSELDATNRELEAFTYSVSHDLRAPLRQIDGFSRMLMEEAGQHLDLAARHYLHRILEGTRHMGRLIDDLLHLARVGRQDVRRRPVSLSSLVEQVLTDLESESAGREIEWKIDPLPTVECDPGLMRVLFTNLLGNAVKYTRHRRPAVIEVTLTSPNGQPVIAVRDNGVGFDMKYADQLFGVFQRLHSAEEFEGTGVGLATVQRIVHKHGGRIWAESAPERGAAFHFTVGPAPGPPSAEAQ
jgi:PAS domain S-box-containing protein